MKTLAISIILLLSAFICNAQIPAPNQTDTLIITSVKYNYADIDQENWPCDIIYKSTKDIRIGGQTFAIISANKSLDNVYFMVYDINDHNKKVYTLTFSDKKNDKYLLSFSGYEFMCYKKAPQPIVYSSEESSTYNKIFEGEPNARLAGRSVNGTLHKPSYRVVGEGKVVVKIWVDQYGNVTKAQAGVEGTTATDKSLWQAAYKAAMGAHFNMDASAPSLQEGTITYIFNI